MSNETPVISEDIWLQRLAKHNSTRSYSAMYSTWWDGIVTDPKMMMIPIDDHQVHRGDAVFEAFRVINGKVYLLKEHLDRLERSSKALGLKCPLSREKLVHTITQTVAASKKDHAVVRLFLGRGPGSFSVSPYDTLGEQLHLVVTEFSPPSEQKRRQGVTMITSKIEAKSSFWAQIKSCNYLINVLMKKEALDQKADFSVGVDECGHLTEGSTENLVVLSKEGVLIHPRLTQILSGCTMRRCFELTSLKVTEAPLSWDDIFNAKEVMMIGTTIDVLSVVEFDGEKLGEGKPGVEAKKLQELLLKDQETFIFLP